jgi:hypothetical protein
MVLYRAQFMTMVDCMTISYVGWDYRIGNNWLQVLKITYIVL